MFTNVYYARLCLGRYVQSPQIFIVIKGRYRDLRRDEPCNCDMRLEYLLNILSKHFRFDIKVYFGMKHKYMVNKYVLAGIIYDSNPNRETFVLSHLNVPTKACNCEFRFMSRFNKSLFTIPRSPSGRLKQRHFSSFASVC